MMPDTEYFDGWGWGIPQYFENGEWWYWIPGTGTMPRGVLEVN